MNAEIIKSVLSMRQVAARYGYDPDRTDCIKCPFHNDTHPSLRIYSEPGRGFYCYSCGAGGSVIDFVMRLFRINYKQALLRIGSDFGFSDDPPDREAERRIRAEQSAKRLAERNRQNELNRLSAEHCRLWWTIKTDEPFSNNWCNAINTIDAISYRLEALECRK